MIGTVMREGGERAGRWSALIAAAACVLWFAADIRPGRAQTALSAEEARLLEFGKEIFKSKAVCQYCHKWDASGDQGYGGNALSLRATHLTPEQLSEVVKCGRPGTACRIMTALRTQTNVATDTRAKKWARTCPRPATISCRNARSTPSSNICSPRTSDAGRQRMRTALTFGARAPGNAIR